MTRIVIPNGWKPRKHQLPLWRFIDGGGKRAVAVWHRRAGKDSTALNLTASQAFERIGTYWHLLPEAAQGRKAIWDGIDKDSRRIIDQVFPDEIRKRTIDNEMKIELKNGSFWNVVGSDNYNSLVGSNPIGVVFSEYSISNPAAWDYLRPILAENGGWAMFLYTPRGKNHGKKLFDMAKRNPEWFAELLTVTDTCIIPPEVIQEEIDSGMDDDMVQQEYFCSWEGVRQGSIYGEQLAKARREGRIGSIPYDRRHPVNTFWDIGHSDTTSIIAHQFVGGQDRFLASMEDSGQDVPYFVGELKKWSESKGFLYGHHYLPHDSKNVTLAAKSNPLGKNVWDQLFAMGCRDLRLVPRTPDRWTAINATRARFSTAYFDEVGCSGLLDALGSYHKKWDEARKCFQNEPNHDWSSNYCDAFRQWAQGFTETGASGVFSMPSALPGKLKAMPSVHTVGQSRAGY